MRSDKFQCLLNEKVHTRGNSLVCVAKSVRMDLTADGESGLFPNSPRPAARLPAAAAAAAFMFAVPS